MSSINALPQNVVAPQGANDDVPTAAPTGTSARVRTAQVDLSAADGTEAAGAPKAPSAAHTESLPNLPMPPTNAIASAAQAGHSVSLIASSGGDAGAFSSIMAFQILFEASQRQQNSANRARVAEQQAANNEAQTAAMQQLTQIKADQSSSILKFAAGTLASALPFGMMRMAKPENQSLVAGAAPAISQALTSGVDAADQNLFFGNTSLNAQVDQKITDIRKNLANQQAEAASGSVKQAESAVEMALRSLGEFFQRKSQTETTIANNV